MDYTVRGILQAKILEWVTFPFSRGIFPTQGSNSGLSHYRRIFLPAELPEKPKNTGVGSLSLLQWNLFNPGMEPRSPALQADSLQTEPPGKPKYVDDTTVMTESEEELKSLLIRVREKSEKKLA